MSRITPLAKLGLAGPLGNGRQYWPWITLVDERIDRERSFYFEGGLQSFVRHLNRNKEALHRPIYVERRQGSTAVEVALQYNDTYNEIVFPFVNNIHTAVLLAGSTYTTVGFASVTLPLHWQLLEVTMAVTGLFAFAWSTSIMYALSQQLYRAED